MGALNHRVNRPITPTPHVRQSGMCTGQCMGALYGVMVWGQRMAGAYGVPPRGGGMVAAHVETRA
jgi:hypothetical protein